MATCKDCGCTIGYDCECDPEWNEMVQEAERQEEAHETMHDVLESIEYKDWEFCVGLSRGASYIQVKFKDGNNPQYGRKWLISSHATKSEIVQTCLKAVLTSEEHEAREKFLYKRRNIFSPHYDVDALHEINTKEKFDARQHIELSKNDLK